MEGPRNHSGEVPSTELRYDANSGYSAFSDDDDPAEVDATFRSQRRIATIHFLVFLSVTLGAGVALVALPWTADASVFGGFTPGFAIVAFGLYLFFVTIGAAISSLANGVEDRMLGAGSLPSSVGPQSQPPEPRQTPEPRT